MKEPENLQKTDSTLDLSKEEEKKLLLALRNEAASFVPDRLLSVLEACHIDISTDEKSEKNILASLQGTRFVPNELPVIEKATGTFDPFGDKDNLTLTVKVHNEGESIVPDVKAKIYQETGVRKRFSFGAFLKAHWLPMVGGTAALALAISAVSVAFWGGTTNVATAQGTYLTVTLTPASYSEDSSSSPEANCYQPSWSFSTNSENTVQSYSCDNYSATLALKNFEPDFASKKAYDAVSSLITPAHTNGYLETRDASQKNVINIVAVSTDSSYADTYYSAFQGALDKALTLASNRIYAVVNFSASTIDTTYLKGLSEETAGDIVSLYSSFSSLDSKDALTLTELRQGDPEVLAALESAVAAGEEAKLSDKGLVALKEGLLESYRLYLNNVVSTYSASQIEAMREELIQDVNAIPWLHGSHLGDLLRNDAYFIMGDDLGFPLDPSSPWYLYSQIRDYILKTKTADADTYVQYLEEVKALADVGKESTGYFPDDQEGGIDNGGHVPGDGPNGHDWGDGGGEWYGQPPRS